MITFESSGDWSKTEDFLRRMGNDSFITDALNAGGRRGVEALRSATPRKTGKTASSWTYEISKTSAGYEISWSNSNVQNGVNIAVILQYGHGTGTGGYVRGIDYINPSLRPIFESIEQDIEREVSR